jgi:hypothetical protein
LLIIIKTKLAGVLTLAAYEMTTLENHLLVKNLLMAYWAGFMASIRNSWLCGRK